MTTTVPYSHLCSECSEKLRFPGSSVPAAPIGNQRPDVEDHVTDNEQEYDEDEDCKLMAYTMTGQRFDCDYTIIDSYPDLPLLTRRSSGCEFCRLLRHSLMSREFRGLTEDEIIDPVTRLDLWISLNYLWDFKNTRHNVCGNNEDDKNRVNCESEDNDYDNDDIRVYCESEDDDYDNNDNDNEGGNVGLWFLVADIHDNSQFNGLHMGSISFPLTTTVESIQTFLHMRPSICRDPFSERSIAFIQRELDYCANTCAHHQPLSDFLPTRLIATTEDPDKCRIIYSQDLPPATSSKNGNRYIALTYCWGNSEEAPKQKKLTPSNASTLSTSGFSIAGLTPIQRDTINLAKALLIPFIWIDALCILQGDRDDWEREASQMEDIYSNAFFTVCSLTSWSCMEGFTSVEETISVPVAFRSPLDPDAHGEIFINGNYVIGKNVLDPEQFSKVDISQSRWVRRAWTFQELALSPRFVHFGRSGVGFQCKSKFMCDWSGLKGYPDRMIELGLNGAVGNKDEDARNNGNGSDFWYTTVIPEYSRRKISQPSDIFPALSGLAKRASKTIQSQYFAGMWRRDLPFALMWTKELPEAPSLSKHIEVLDSQPEFIKPSWSWAGCGRVFFNVGDFAMFDHEYMYYKDKCITPVHAEVVPRGCDPFGSIESASLSFKASVYPLSEGYYLPTKFDGRFHGMCYVGRGEDRPLINFQLDWMPDATDKDLGKLTLVLLGTATPIGDDPYMIRKRYLSLLERPFGLLVHPSVREKSKYVRAGTFSAKSSHHKEDRFLPLEIKFFEDLERRVIELL